MECLEQNEHALKKYLPSRAEVPLYFNQTFSQTPTGELETPERAPTNPTKERRAKLLVLLVEGW